MCLSERHIILCQAELLARIANEANNVPSVQQSVCVCVYVKSVINYKIRVWNAQTLTPTDTHTTANWLNWALTNIRTSASKSLEKLKYMPDAVSSMCVWVRMTYNDYVATATPTYIF